MRAQVRLIPQWLGVPDEDLPWAEYILAIGNGFTPTKSGDPVWVEFPYIDADGNPDTRRPLIVGAAQDAPGGVPNVAPEASGQGDGWKPEEVEGAPPRPSLSPTEDFVVHRNNLMELRSAGGGYEIANTASGSRIGMSEGGKIYVIGPAEIFTSAGSNVKIIAGGNIELEAKGNIAMKTEGQFSVKAASIKFDKG